MLTFINKSDIISLSNEREVNKEMNLLTIIITLLVLQANGIIVPKAAWILTWATWILKAILETIKDNKNT